MFPENLYCSIEQRDQLQGRHSDMGGPNCLLNSSIKLSPWRAVYYNTTRKDSPALVIHFIHSSIHVPACVFSPVINVLSEWSSFYLHLFFLSIFWVWLTFHTWGVDPLPQLFTKAVALIWMFHLLPQLTLYPINSNSDRVQWEVI